MKTNLIQILLFIFPFALAAQTDEPKQPTHSPQVDTITVYNCSYGRRQVADSITYLINDQPATKEQVYKVANQAIQSKKCNPCILKKIDLEGHLDSYGEFYFECPGSEKSIELKTKSKSNESTNIRDNSCYEGEWRYYDKNGKLKSIKYFDHGTEVKEKTKHLN